MEGHRVEARLSGPEGKAHRFGRLFAREGQCRRRCAFHANHDQCDGCRCTQRNASPTGARGRARFTAGCEPARGRLQASSCERPCSAVSYRKRLRPGDLGNRLRNKLAGLDRWIFEVLPIEHIQQLVRLLNSKAEAHKNPAKHTGRPSSTSYTVQPVRIRLQVIAQAAFRLLCFHKEKLLPINGPRR